MAALLGQMVIRVILVRMLPATTLPPLLVVLVVLGRVPAVTAVMVGMSVMREIGAEGVEAAEC